MSLGKLATGWGRAVAMAACAWGLGGCSLIPPFCGYTPAICGADGVAALEKIDLGGMQQAVLMRGNDVSNPVLLWLHGGPGAAQMPVARHFNGDLERNFVVVHWDQRGAGLSNPRDFDESSMSVEQFVADTHELTQYLKQRFNTDRIFLLGHSWGTHIGIEAVSRWPEDYHAYIGVSQLANTQLAEEIGWSWLRQQSQGTRRESDVAEIGPPPYVEHDRYVAYARMIESFGGGMDVGMVRLAFAALRAPEYCMCDYFAWLGGSTRGSGPMWDPEKPFDVFERAPRLDVPAYFLSGRNDYNTPGELVEQYYDMLDAPAGKQMIWFENSAHAPFMGEPDKFFQELVRISREAGVR